MTSRFFHDEKMADASNDCGADEPDIQATRKRFEVLDKKYRHLKGLSQRGWLLIPLGLTGQAFDAYYFGI